MYTLDEENLIVEFKESKRVYNVDTEGNVKEEDSNILVSDTTPGEFEGSGTETDPFIIMSIEDLVYLAKTTKEDSKNYSGQYVKFGKSLNFESELSYADYQTTEYNEFLGVENNIGLMEALTNEEYSGFNPLGSFRGTLDGDGKSLKNMYINKAGNAGLIAYLNGGTVKNLEITGKIICTGDNAGSISAGWGTVRDCISRVDIEATGNYIAGIIGGENGGGVYNSQNYGNIIGINTVGGINSRYGKATNCQNYGKISGTSSIGGINGECATIEGCKNYGEIEGENNAGGIIGQTTTGFVNKCINHGIVNAKSSAGGIVGDPLLALIMNCINMADVKVESEKAGGIAGVANNFEAIINCYNYGNISGKQYIGGILGIADFIEAGHKGEIINCYTTGTLEAENINIGGIIGRKNGYGTNYIKNCYWQEELGLESVGSISVGNIELTDSEAYSLEYMKTNEFLDKLNSYVETYNQGDKESTSSKELLTWKFDEETGFPTLSF